jgi:cellulose synthase/poly-beta-1,6-N-acetylglucosamine synthase-like glycosyltransferase
MANETAQIATLIVYYVVLAFLAMYGAHRMLMVVLYYRHRRDVPRPHASELSPLPRVTVQLPLFNEVYVAERLIEAVTNLDYPRELLEIQVLDDSTDETREVARATVERFRARGFDIVYLHRKDRRGFKAGALQAGMEAARGDYLMIFDADFVPQPEIIKKALPYFVDPRVGMVQARWEHLNRDFSLLTRIQSILLDGNFLIEHTARHSTGRFLKIKWTGGK